MLSWTLQLEFPHIGPTCLFIEVSLTRGKGAVFHCISASELLIPNLHRHTHTHTHTHSFSRIGNCMQAQGNRNPWPKTGSWEEPRVQNRCWPNHEPTCSLLLQNARLLHWKQWFSTGAAPYTHLGNSTNYGCLWAAVQINIVRGSQKALGAHFSPEFPGDYYYYFKMFFVFLDVDHF